MLAAEEQESDGVGRATTTAHPTTTTAAARPATTTTAKMVLGKSVSPSSRPPLS
jgi:hypothetical protein